MALDRSSPIKYVRARLPGVKSGPFVDLSDRVWQLVYEDDEAKADKLTLTVDNFDLSNFDDPIWSKGNEIEVQWGYSGNLGPKRTCVIQKVTGFEVLQVEALDRSIKAHKEEKSRSWSNVTRSAVVREVAKEEGYDAELVHIEDTDVTYETIVQVRETNAALLKRLANKEGFEFFVDFDGLHWHRKRLGQRPLRTFVWYGSGVGDLLSLNVENDVTAKPAAVTAKGRDPIKKEAFEVKGDDKSTERDGAGAVLEMIDPRKASTYDAPVAAGTAKTVPTTEPNAEAAKRTVDGAFRQSAITLVKLSGKAIGDPNLVAKSMVVISGIRSLSGHYYVSSVKHTVSESGYEIEFKAKRDGRSSTPGTKPAISSAAVNAQEPKKEGELEPVETIDGRRAVTTWTDTRGRG